MTLPLAAGRDWLALGVAAYGAVVATAVAIYQAIRDKPGVRLVLMPTHVSFDDGSPSLDLWCVRVVNHRKRPITIREGGLLGTRGERIHTAIVTTDGSLTQPFPQTLTDGKSFEFHAPIDFRRDRDYAGAWVIDDLNRIYEVHEPPRDPRRRWRQYQARRRFEKAITTAQGRGAPKS